RADRPSWPSPLPRWPGDRAGVQSRGHVGGCAMTDPARPADRAPTVNEVPGAKPDGPPTDPAAPQTGADELTHPGPASEELPCRVGRYRVEGEVARGGMGVVLRCRDDEMGRALAAKLLLPKHRGDAALQRRFLEEARLTGQLQHPGVPPVHELGR